MNHQLSQRVAHTEDVGSKIYQAMGDISKLKSMIHGLDLQINEYEKLNSRLVDDQKHRLQENSHEYNKAHELTAKLQGLEAKYYSLEVDERGKNTDLEAVNYSNQALMDRNLDLKSEFEALQKHVVILTQQNRDLQRELDSFVETDDIVRRNLDRKEKVNEIRTKVDYAIHNSINNYSMNNKSPMKANENMINMQHAQSYNHGNANSSSYGNNRDFSPARKGG